MSETGPSLQRPATRAARLSAIEQALATHIITSQSQLSKILIDEGIAVTQATLSRDLDEMHAVKTRLKDGTVAYTVGRSVVASEGEDVGERGEAQMSRVSPRWPPPGIWSWCTRLPVPHNTWPR